MSGTSALEDRLQLLPNARRAAPRITEATVRSNTDLGASQHRLLLTGEWIARNAQAGEFVMITVPGGAEGQILLPRPMAIHRRYPDAGLFEVIFKVVGRGTRALASIAAGESLTITGPLGNAFSTPPDATSVLLIGRGIGVCSVMGVAEDAQLSGVRATMVISSRSPETAIGLDDCDELGAEAFRVDDAAGNSAPETLERMLRERFDTSPPQVVMVCGSQRLTVLGTTLAESWGADLQVSLEANMACGIGYCHGCAAPMRSRPDREGPLVCVDGPVFRVEV
ncbi:dihydroorotate oxidase electron transfer subunit [Agrococcus sp. Marseille-Q4369]|uniref:iron-sulfur cluster-binding protein n=1 Tax=Agrococcus sp. Marseille-Q4369 TaxID=2810513 RepID=UPI001B8B0383|nr:dihydroorotate oxidase electron transfer subunit [Agrococcus sp. Marseille-Q4369]QUW17824.1 dihydroorotate oxidase electron transfer subunit [Agrococcus sp. Marseille-Q4369]